MGRGRQHEPALRRLFCVGGVGGLQRLYAGIGATSGQAVGVCRPLALPGVALTAMLLQVFVAFPAKAPRSLRLLARVASQINIFSIGFPVTLGVGLLGMLLTLPALTGPFTMALERMLANFR